MNTTLTPKISPLGKGLRLSLACGLMAVSSLTATAAVVANFSGGTGTTVVDAWTGKAGDGWAGEWKLTKNSGTLTASAVVSSASPFSAGEGNYLQAQVVNSDSGAKGMTVARQYNGVPLNQSQTITFDFRLDSAVSDLRRIYLYDNATLSLGGEVTGTSWLIRLNSGNIQVYNGKTATTLYLPKVGSDPLVPFKLVQGNVFRFTIDVFAAAEGSEATYSVNVLNVTTGISVGGEGFKFYDAAVTNVAGMLNFYSSVDAGKTVTLSLDNISVIPESSTVVLSGLGLAALFFFNRSRIRSVRS